MSTPLESLHDLLMGCMPEGAKHDSANCPLCSGDHQEASDTSTREGGAVSDKTYTEDEYNSVLAKVSDLEAKVADLTAAAGASETDAKVAAATADLERQCADVQSKLDAAVLEAEAAKTSRDEMVSWFEDLCRAETEAAELAARREARVAKVAEVAAFPEDYLNANADRFAAMGEDEFEAALQDWKTIAPKRSGQIPAVTAMTAALADNRQSQDVLSEICGLRFQGVDTRTI